MIGNHPAAVAFNVGVHSLLNSQLSGSNFMQATNTGLYYKFFVAVSVAAVCARAMLNDNAASENKKIIFFM